MMNILIDERIKISKDPNSISFNGMYFPDIIRLGDLELIKRVESLDTRFDTFEIFKYVLFTKDLEKIKYFYEGQNYKIESIWDEILMTLNIDVIEWANNISPFNKVKINVDECVKRMDDCDDPNMWKVIVWMKQNLRKEDRDRLIEFIEKNNGVIK
jgi:hypothetical protein